MARGVTNPAGTMSILAGASPSSVVNNFTMGAHFWMSSTTANWNFKNGTEVSPAGNWYGLIFNVAAANRFEVAHNEDGVLFETLGGGTFPLSTWFGGAYRRQAGTGQVWMNGATLGSTFGNAPPTPAANMYGCHVFPGTYQMGICEDYFYDAAITDGQLAAITSGVCPMRVRLANLLTHKHCRGNDSPELDSINATFNGTVTGLTSVAHPTIVIPQHWAGTYARMGR